MASKKTKEILVRFLKYKEIFNKNPRLFIKKVLGIYNTKRLTNLILAMRLRELSKLNKIIYGTVIIKTNDNWKDSNEILDIQTFGEIELNTEYTIKTDAEEIISIQNTDNFHERLKIEFEEICAGDPKIWEVTFGTPCPFLENE